MNAKAEILSLLVMTCRSIRRGQNLSLVSEAADWERTLSAELERARANPEPEPEPEHKD